MCTWASAPWASGASSATCAPRTTRTCSTSPARRATMTCSSTVRPPSGKASLGRPMRVLWPPAGSMAKIMGGLLARHRLRLRSPAPQPDFRRRPVVLVLDVAHDFLERVFQRDSAADLAVFVAHQRHVPVRLLEELQCRGHGLFGL